MEGSHLYDGLLALDARRDPRLPEVDDEVPALEVSGDGEGDVDVADGLRPLVGEGGLLSGLLGAGSGLLGGVGFCAGHTVSRGVARRLAGCRAQKRKPQESGNSVPLSAISEKFVRIGKRESRAELGRRWRKKCDGGEHLFGCPTFRS